MKGFVLAGIALASVSSSFAVDSAESARAQADLDHAIALAKDKDLPGAIAAAKKAIEEDPELIPAHEKFIQLTEDSIVKRDATFEKTEAEAVATLKAQYDEWTKANPNSAGVQFGLGSLYWDSEDPRAKPYLVKAVELNPKLAKAYEMLSIDAERWGNERAAQDYMGKASAADPADAGYAFYYADFFRDTDPAKYKSLSLAVTEKFPNDERGAQSLYWLGENSNSDSDKITYWEMAKQKYPPSKFQWSASAMSPLFDVYARTSPEKALALAKQMLDWSEKDEAPMWMANVALAQNLLQVHSLFASGQYAQAKTLLDASKINRYSSDLQMFELLKAEAAAGAGDTKGAYDLLLDRYAKTPEEPVHDAILKYGASLGKTSAQIDSDVWALRDASAKPAAGFDLPQYLHKGNLTLEDFKGKVVLLTFWFPGCGPCRGEFPHFENVVKKFRGKPVEYIGINVLPSQDDYVKPFMRGTRYSFTPLRGSSEFAQSAYHVRGEPTNFLIDGNGRIVYTNFRAQDPESEHVLETMIQSLLDHRTGA